MKTFKALLPAILVTLGLIAVVVALVVAQNISEEQRKEDIKNYYYWKRAVSIVQLLNNQAELSEDTNGIAIEKDGNGYHFYLTDILEESLPYICESYNSAIDDSNKKMTPEIIQDKIANDVDGMVEAYKSGEWESYCLYDFFNWIGDQRRTVGQPDLFGLDQEKLDDI